MLNPQAANRLASKIQACEEWERKVAAAFEAMQNEADGPDLRGLPDFVRQTSAASHLAEVQDLVALAPERAWNSQDMLHLIQVLGEARRRWASVLEHAMGEPTKLPARYAFRIEPQGTMTRSASAKPAEDAKLIEEFVRHNPGHYMAELHRLMTVAGFTHSYATMVARVRELERNGVLLTVGVKQGIKRFCFPHPDRVDRRKYYGANLAFHGVIERKITDEFDEVKAPYDVYYVNTKIKPVLLLLPWQSKSKFLGKEVEGFGLVESIPRAAKAFGVSPKKRTQLDDDIKEMVRPRRLYEHQGEEIEPIELPQFYLAN